MVVFSGTATLARKSKVVAASGFAGWTRQISGDLCRAFCQRVILLLGLLFPVIFTATQSHAQDTFAWENGAAAPLPRYEAQGLAVDGLLYVFGGFFTNAGGPTATSQAHVYDPAADLWSPLGDMPEPLTHAGQAADGPTVYVAGGFVGDDPGGSTDRVWVYDTATDFWMPGPSLPADRGGGGLVRLGRELHYFSGATRTAGVNVLTDFGDHWVLGLGPSDSPFDDDFGWTAAAPLPNPRNHMGAAAVGGLAYAIGGQHGNNESSGNQASVHAYDPASDTWTQVADLPKPLGHITASGFVMNGRIVVTGGVTNNGKTADVVEYDPDSDTWVALPDLPAARQSPVSGIIGDQMVVTSGLGGAIETTTCVLADRWDRPELLPVPLGEVAGGVIDGKIYLVGEGDPATLAFDLSTGTWGSATANVTRPFAGHHHTAEVLGGELYLLGGLGASSEGAVQVYDPVADLWEVGSPAPFAAGSSASAVIGGEIYLAGGIVGSSTTDKAAVYDPVADSWSSLAPMPLGVNHAASGTDGARLYIFGGRSGGNTVGNGFDVVQIFDPATGLWVSSAEPGSTLVPLPQARGGTGKAVFFNGEFYVLGGETMSGAGATADGVYDRVDIYDPVADTWRSGTAMPTARHGIFPLLHAGRVYVLGGGVAAGNSQSVVNETFNPGVEIVGGIANELLSSTTSLDFGDTGAPGAPDIVVQATDILVADAADFSDDFDDAAGVTLVPGQSTTVMVTFTPASVGSKSATLTINHTGSNTPTTVSLVGNAIDPPPPQSALYRVNVGGASLTGTPNWDEDSTANPSPFGNAAATNTFSTGSAIDMSDASLPPGTPMTMLQIERWDPSALPEMLWSFPVTPGLHEVRLYFADIYSGTQSPGARVFDVLIEGNLVLDDYDIFADVGGFTGVMKSFQVNADSNLDIAFGHVIENPALKGIEIIPNTPNELSASPVNLAFGFVLLGDSATLPVQLTNSGAPGAPDIVVQATDILGADAADFSDDFDDAAGVTLVPGQSTTVMVTFTPASVGSKSATLTINHTGSNTPTTVSLVGSAIDPPPPQSALLSSTTSLDFGDTQVGDSATLPVQLTNSGAPGAPDIVVQATDILGADFSDDFDDAAGVTLAPGQSTTVMVTFTPSAAGPAATSLEISHSGSNNSLMVTLTGSGGSQIPISFGGCPGRC